MYKMPKPLYLFASLLLAVFTGLLYPVAPAQAQAKNHKPLTDADVELAIQKIKTFLFEAQDESGAWYGAHHTGPGNTEGNRNAWGPTAAATLALIMSGESPQRPEIRKALEILAESEVTGTYAFSLRAHVWSYLPDRFLPLLARDGEIMLNSVRPSQMNNTNFGYTVSYDSQPGGGMTRLDNSTTQYGILALWQARKRGVPVPNQFWEEVILGFEKMQQPDGGWAYSTGRASTQSMTVAGLTCMMVAQQEVLRNKSDANPKVASIINGGLKYLDENFDASKMSAHGGGGYVFYGYERVGLASGRKYFGDSDWFEIIAREIIGHNARYGASIHNAAFELMFLTRGRVPVWINKLEVPGVAWNNRPNDVYFLNEFISNYREHEVNWQVANIDTMPAKDWIGAPLTWFSSKDGFQLNQEQADRLKQYIDYGGTVIFNAEENSTGFRASVQALAQQLYPQYSFEPMPAEHPMVNLLIGSDRQPRRAPMQMLTNGARVLMVMPEGDWGLRFQADTNPNPNDGQQPHWRYITNIYAVATDRGELKPRLYNPIIERTADRQSEGTIKVMLPTIGGKPLPEADIYSAMKNYMFNETGYDIEVVEAPLSELAATNPSLLHMVGVGEAVLAPDEVNAIKAYVDAGGTVLLENLGGRGDFVRSVRGQINSILPGEDQRLRVAPILTRSGLPAGAKINTEVIYRRMTLELANPGKEPLLRGISKGDRYPILVSNQDISLGLLGARQYGINGYSVESARNLMLNILLEAKIAHPGG